MLVKVSPKTVPLRSERGATGVIVSSMILISILGIGSFAADVSHNSAVRSELQNATDAAALAGAKALVSEDTRADAETQALLVAAANRADGESVINDDDGTITVELEMAPAEGEIGTCQVTATRKIRNWLAAIFGRPTDTVTVKSKASASQTMTVVDKGILFPLAVSIDAVPTKSAGGAGGGKNPGNGGNGRNDNSATISEKPLKDLKIGDTVHIYINSQQVKNGAFTSFTLNESNANWFNNVIDQSLSLSAPSDAYTVPEVRVGDHINFSNGVAGQKSLAEEPRFSALKAESILYLPVMEGQPPYNQSRQLIGWFAIKVKDVEVNQSGGVVETISGEIVKAPLRGKNGDIPPVPSGDNKSQRTLEDLSPSHVRLVPVT